MPATEKTWRNQKTMHVVFGVSSMIMLLSTVWMIAKDYVREWKDYQTTYFAISRWTDAAQLKQTHAQTDHTLRQRRAQLRETQSAPVADDIIENFRGVVQVENKRLDGLDLPTDSVDFDELKSLQQTLNEAGRSASEARKAAGAAHQQIVEALRAQRAAANPPTETTVTADAVDKAGKNVQAAQNALAEAEEIRLAAEDAAIEARSDLIAALTEVSEEAKRREDIYVREKKSVAAVHTEKLSLRDGAIAKDAPPTEIAQLQGDISNLAQQMDELDQQIAAAKDYRTSLEQVVRGDIRGDELEMQKEVDDVQQELDRLNASIRQNSLKIGDAIVRAPILDAFNTTDLKIDNGWLPKLTINYNFSDVARFDRCATCHKAIEKTAPGSATEPAFPTVQPEDRLITIELATPASEPTVQVNETTGELTEPSLERDYGIELADYGPLSDEDVAIQVVTPESLAAQAGLKMGDIIAQIEGASIYKPELVQHYLMENAKWGQTIQVTIRRGLPHPYTSHPRLDLYVGSLSPHPKGEFGCTICHDGQGSSTSFKYASHSPNTPREAHNWLDDHDWFFNHHWIFPMTPRRFLESNCLKCHHDVVELEPSERYPDPPAPKLVAGWKAIKHFGCYGCHEINGYDGDKRIGPDLRNEPNYFAVAAQVGRDAGLDDDERQWAEQIASGEDAQRARQKLRLSIEADAKLAESRDDDAAPRLTSATHKLGEELKDVDNPGQLRRVGPSLRYLNHKVDFAWLYDWVNLPANFRPSTKMPQFFGLHNHLDDQDKIFTIEGLEGTPQGQKPTRYTDLHFTQRMEAIEVRAIAEYLLAASGDFEPVPQPQGVTEPPSAERGKWEFQKRCVACHTHKDFPGIASDFGPELSNVGAKFNTEKGRKWLVSWIRQPTHYNVRTKMPDLFLGPQPVTDANGNPTGQVTDPAADIAEFLLNVPSDWSRDDSLQRELSAEELESLEHLALEWMSTNFSTRKSKKYLREGIPAEVGAKLKGDEKVFVGMDPENRVQTKLMYIGRRSISKYGCSGCHDIPGFETAKAIGTTMADWGRKEPSKLAFEQIQKFLVTHGVDGAAEEHDEHAHHGDGHHGLDPLSPQFDADTGFYLMALNMHQRQGFIWQKLRMPRSYDFKKTTNKSFNERLRMPRFPLDKQTREQIVTFVLGLTSEAPAEPYIYQPDPRQRAIMDGKLLLTKYNCGGCHTLQMEKWQLELAEHEINFPTPPENFAFLHPEFSPEALSQSQQKDVRGRYPLTVVGRPLLDPATGEPKLYESNGGVYVAEGAESPPHYKFNIYKPTVWRGQPVTVGQQALVLKDPNGFGPAEGVRHPTWGGDLARYLYPHVIERAKGQVPPFDATDDTAATEAWGWLPPHLIDEGTKVRTDWLHDFLLNPYRIRPAAVLRMPRFNMSDDEASKFANYFAALDNADYPYEFEERRQDSYLEVVEAERPNHLQDAFKILIDKKEYCAQCHTMGDYLPAQILRSQGPDLADAHVRLRGDFMRRWIADPPQILPYTGMPVNFGYGKLAAQQLYPGNSLQQIDAVVDLLVNYDTFIRQHYKVAPLVEAAAPVEEPPSTVSTEAGGGGQ